MKSAKQSNSAASTATGRFANIPVIGSVVAFFSAGSRLREAERVAREDAPRCRQVIESADKVIQESERRLRETDELIARSRQQASP